MTPLLTVNISNKYAPLDDWKKWQVEEDNSIDVELEASPARQKARLLEKDRIDAEVKTPILSTANFVKEITDVITHIERQLNAKKWGWQTNESTGLHVHVGRADANGQTTNPFTVHELRRIAMTVLIFEG